MTIGGRTAHALRRAVALSCVLPMVVVSMLFVAVLAPPARADAEAVGLRLYETGPTTRFEVNLSERAHFRVVTIPEPYRVVIDLVNVTFRLPDVPGENGTGLVKAFRYGKFAEGKARIVLDTNGPVKVDKIDFSDRAATGGLLSIDLVKTDERLFGKAYRKRKRREKILQEDAEAWQSEIKPEKKPKGNRRIVVIDPGHGGVDSGAIAHGRTREKDVVLAFSHNLRRALEKTGRYVVRMTRRKDVFVPLRRRVDYARKQHADLFISIHADIVVGKTHTGISGTTVYTLSDGGSDSAARELARRENESDAIAGIDSPDQSNAVTNILIDLAQRETNTRSDVFARAILRQVRKATRLSRGPHRSAGFRVLKAPDIPSVLIELGYLSNPADEKRLRSEQWRTAVAGSIARSVGGYFRRQTSALPY